MEASSDQNPDSNAHGYWSLVTDPGVALYAAIAAGWIAPRYFTAAAMSGR